MILILCLLKYNVVYFINQRYILPMMLKKILYNVRVDLQSARISLMKMNTIG